MAKTKYGWFFRKSDDRRVQIDLLEDGKPNVAFPGDWESEDERKKRLNPSPVKAPASKSGKTA